jgi:hypothetical protein
MKGAVNPTTRAPLISSSTTRFQGQDVGMPEQTSADVDFVPRRAEPFQLWLLLEILLFMPAYETRSTWRDKWSSLMISDRRIVLKESCGS